MTNGDPQDQWLTEVLASSVVSPTKVIVQGIADHLRFDPESINDTTWLQATADSFRAFAVANPTGY